MPRLTDRSAIYTLTHVWLDVVEKGGSLFLPHTDVWVKSTIDSLYEQIVTTPDDKAARFHPTLFQQAHAEGPAGQRLAAEALFVWQLKDSSSRAATKRKQVDALLEGLSPAVTLPADVLDGFEYGMANYGPGRIRSLQDYVFILRFASEWSELDPERRAELLGDPWEFRTFIRGLAVPQAVFAQDAIQHLVHPDTFEPIASLRAKRNILKSLGQIKVGKKTDLDREIAKLRAEMEADGRGRADFNFYEPDIRPLWDEQDGDGDDDGTSDDEDTTDDRSTGRDTDEESSPVRPAVGRLRLADLEAAVTARELLIDRSVLAGLVAALNSGKHVVLTGAPGTAKTTLAEAVATVAYDAGRCTGHTLATATADWSTYETVGGYRPRANGTLEFEPGVMLESIATNRWLVLDEMNRANTDRALGPLFTVLSGQAVELPAERQGRRVRILPAHLTADDRYFDHIVSRDWRIIATTNVLDRALLFDLSFALMRRFAFIEVKAPDVGGYRELIHRALADFAADTATIGRVEGLVDRLLTLTDQRALGPALFMDAAKYMAAYVYDDPGVSDADLVLGAFFAFLLPQFEGADEKQAAVVRRVVVHAAGSTTRNRVTETLRQTLGVLLRQADEDEVYDAADEESTGE